MIKIGRRGSINFSLKITGKQGHVAYPENAINPNTILIDILKTLKQHCFDDGNQFFDPTNLEITAINSDNFR
jgi:succinyl-diaminopimelate desuccinylase